MTTRVSIASVTDAPPGTATVLVSKVKLTNDSADRRAEARWLTDVRHPGVVRLHDVTDDPFTIVTEHAGGTTMRTARFEPDGAAEYLAASADVLVDLHAAGRAHGKLTIDHIIVGAGGPVLCSPHGEIVDPSCDIAAIGRCMRDLHQQWMDRGISVRWADSWLELAERLVLGADASLSARRAARKIREFAAPAEPESELGIDRRHPLRSRWGVTAVSTAVAIAFAGLLVFQPGDSTSDEGARVVIDGQIFEVGTAGDVAVAFERPCVESHEVLVLETQTGMIWGYATVEDGAAASPIAVVPGATRLRAQRDMKGPEGEPCAIGVAEGPAGSVRLDGVS